MNFIFLILSLIFAPLLLVAQEVAPDVSFLEKLNSLIPTSANPMVIMAVVFVLELVMRAWPTAKPKSFLILISSSLKLIASIAIKLSDLADKFIQNIKPDPNEPPR